MKTKRITANPIRLAMACGLTAIGLMAALNVAPAQASYVTCQGKVTEDGGVNVPLPTGIQYSVSCTEDIKDITIVSSRPVTYFVPQPTVYLKGGEISSVGGLNCEGGLPGWGFGCTGLGTKDAQIGAPKWSRVIGQFATDRGLCAKKKRVRPRVWAVVTTVQLDLSSNAYITSSEPFRLRSPRCD